MPDLIGPGTPCMFCGEGYGQHEKDCPRKVEDMAKKKPDPALGDIDRAIDRLTTAICRHHTQTAAQLKCIDVKLDAIIARSITDPETLKMIAEAQASLKEHTDKLTLALKDADPTTPEEQPNSTERK